MRHALRAAAAAMLTVLATAAGAQEPGVKSPRFNTAPAAAPAAPAAAAQSTGLEDIVPGLETAAPPPKQQPTPPKAAPKAVDEKPADGLAFPALSGRVVDAAGVLPSAVVADISAKSAALERQTGAQLVVATVPSLGGYEIEEYGYRLGRAWGIGRQGKSDGVILLVAPGERRVRLEVGYGLEPVLTDALSSRIIRNVIVPRFRAGDLPGGIAAGTDAVLAQLGADPAQARAVAAEADVAESGERSSGPGLGTIIWLVVLALFLLPKLFGGRRRRSRFGGVPLVMWGGSGGGWGGGGGFGGGGFGGGGFSGGGGSFGGGGSSGSW